MAALYLDEHVPEALSALLVGLGHVASTTRSVGRKGIPDYAQLWYVAHSKLIFVSLNRNDYLLLHGAWLHWGVTPAHPGILIAPHVPRNALGKLRTAIRQ
jgi:hypothetical protein